jgi:hypothetical protein
MTAPKSVFAVLMADHRSGDLLHTMKLFLSYDQARAYAQELRDKNLAETKGVILQETFIEPLE